MPDALELALANAASNMPKGEELHIENLDSIADPSLDELPDLPDIGRTGETYSVYNRDGIDYAVVPRAPQYNPDNVSFKPKAYMVNDPEQDGLLLLNIKAILSEFPLLNLKLDSLASIVNNVALTIQDAKQSMPQEPSLKHRSLHEWDDQYLINELVERENDLMPFYYELLKRIGSPELQSLVMSSMQGKNNSMVTLAQLCSALGSMAQPQSQHHEPTAQEYPSTVMSRVPPQQAVPQQQYFGQATEEYIRQDYSATIPSMPPTYNPYFKER